jgi:hypothetical protein
MVGAEAVYAGALSLHMNVHASKTCQRSEGGKKRSVLKGHLKIVIWKGNAPLEAKSGNDNERARFALLEDDHD